MAALNLRVQYVGVATDDRHKSWLRNIIDRAAVRSIAESGSAIYHEELSVHIAEHLADVLEELNTDDGEEDADDDFHEDAS